MEQSVATEEKDNALDSRDGGQAQEGNVASAEAQVGKDSQPRVQGNGRRGNGHPNRQWAGRKAARPQEKVRAAEAQTPMGTRLQCPKCNKLVAVRKDGQTEVRCRKCKRDVIVA